MLGQLQKIGKALMLPIAVLPAAALLLRLGQPDVLNIPFIAAAGNAVFSNLAVLFAIGVAVGIAKENQGAAGLAGFIGYEVIVQGSQAINKTVDEGVLGGIIAGLLAGWLYNKYYRIKLPDFLGFFGGRRFVPIVTAAASIVLAFIFGYIWPYLQDGLNTFGTWLTAIGPWGAGVYGLLNRLLIPFGLHHVLNSYIWFMYGNYHGQTGDLHRFFAHDPTAGGYMAGMFPIMMFGLPAAAIAMIAAAKPGQRRVAAGVLGSAAFASFLTGVTEPIEFAFMFLAPGLFVVHAILTGLSMGIAYALGIHHGFSFSAGAIDYFLNMGLARRGWWLIPQGLIFGVVYFVVFYYGIKMFDLKTPGRDEEGAGGQGGFSVLDEYQVSGGAAAAATTTGAVSQARAGNNAMENKAVGYISALGGRENIQEIEACVTRLRLKVNDMSKLNDAELKRLGASGVMKLNQHNAQVVVGTTADMLADEMKKQMK